MISSAQRKNATGQNLSYRDYFRDTRDRIYAFRKSTNNNPNPMENGRGDRFRYDEEGQLVEAWYNAADPANTGAGNSRYDGFVYDALGNRKGSNVVAGRGAVTFYRTDNGLNQYTSWTPSVINYDDDINGSSGNGVLMQEGNITAFYNALNQPTTIFGGTLSAGMNFGFDPLGRCVKRWISASGLPETNPATYFYYDGWNLIQEGTGAAAAERIYLQGNQVDRIVCHYNYAGGGWRYHHYDARGILLTDPSGDLIEQYEYEAFGKPYFYNGSGTPLSNGSAAGNRFLFTGREWLSDLKIYDYRNRLYQPELGRFLQPDPMGFTGESSSVGNPKKNAFATPWSASGDNKNSRRLDSNLYRYCHNDPINLTDPEGLGFLQALSKVLNATKPIGERLVNALKAAGASNKQAEKTVAAGHNVVNKAAAGVVQVGEQMPGSAPSVPQGPAGWGALVAEVINGGIDGLNEGSAIDLRTGKMRHSANNYRAGWWKAFFGLPVDGDQ